MRSNSGHGKSKSSLRDPTMKEHEQEHRKGRKIAPTDMEPLDEESESLERGG